jgi:hypothetical protein
MNTSITSNKDEFINFANEEINNYVSRFTYLKNKETILSYASQGLIQPRAVLAIIANRFIRCKTCSLHTNEKIKDSEITSLIKLLGEN